MNAIHNRLCRSKGWAGYVAGDAIPWTLDGLELGDQVLELGPGFGVTTEPIARRVPHVTALEMDPALAERLRARMGTSVEVVEGDAARMPFGDGRFSAVVCFTMLHHVPSVRQQDDLLREAKRVLRPGGVFAGLDSLPRWKVRLIHLFDTMVPVDPATFPSRLDRAGFQGATVDAERTRFRFRAYAPGPP